jgi:serine/threonine protein phosphatase PrpC
MVKTRLRSAGKSDMGRVRKNNEDAFHIDAERGIFLVVDGIGGNNAGEKAAEIAVEILRKRLERQTGAVEQRVKEAIALANNEIFRAAQGNPEWAGMACVLTVAVMDNGDAVVGHVGDSRLYKIRAGEIRKLTRDHSPVGEREDSAEITEAEAMRHPRRNEVFRDVGSGEHAPDDVDFIDVRRERFEPDAALVICSDGLSDLVTKEEIRSAVERYADDPDAAAKELIAAANRAGGKDNVTAVVVQGDEFRAPASAQVIEEQPSRWRLMTVIAIAEFLLLGVAAYLLFFRPPPPPVVVAPKTLAVGAGRAFSTIAQALEQAHAGDTVEVSSGDYHEQVRLKNGVILRSRIPREARLLASAVGGGPAIFAQNVDYARVSGFLIVGEEQAPLAVAVEIDNSPIELDNTEIEGAGLGIEIRGPRAPAIMGNAIHDCSGVGVVVEGLVEPWLSHNSFQRNKGGALSARGGAKPVVAGNVFEKDAIDLPGVSLDSLREHNFLLDVKPAKPAHAARGGRKE